MVDDDSDVCNSVFVQICERYGNEIDALSLPEPLQTVMLVWHASGIIGNGGFHYLFEGRFKGDPKYAHTLAALMRIGAKKAGAAFRRAIALFPNSEIPESIERGLEIYDAYPEKKLHAIDSQFYDGGDQMTELLAAYIRKNRRHFTPLVFPRLLEFEDE